MKFMPIWMNYWQELILPRQQNRTRIQKPLLHKAQATPKPLQKVKTMLQWGLL